MLYHLYHWVTDTHMDDNGLPGWVDVAGGIIDAMIIGLAFYWVTGIA